MPRSRLLLLMAALALVLAGCEAAEEPDVAETEPAATPADTATEPTVTETATTPAETEPTPTDTATELGAAPDQTLLERAQEQADFALLQQAIQASGLADQLEEPGPFTLFAPNDEAFQSMDQATLTGLLADPAEIRDIIAFHVVEGRMTSADLEDGTTLETLQGETLEVSVTGDDITVDGATVVRADVEAANGVLHVVDGVLMP